MNTSARLKAVAALPKSTWKLESRVSMNHRHLSSCFMREQIARFCIVVLHVRKWYLITLFLQSRPERGRVKGSLMRKWRAFAGASFQRPLWELAAHKRSIYSEMYPETKCFPCYWYPQTPHWSQAMQAGSRGSGSGGEKRLNNALIQLVRLEARNPLLDAQAQAQRRQRKGGEDSEEMPPK